ncbi:energy transducer TonB [Neolewinella antarctica]|uniref:TonB C-terminal domain-containing protein n=1 Tax=Neolewinella antarctica TaxID=442734 RepID=A0ABX0XGI2_9BACT|nr:energy transducer TonB [Neolewinella antarctica]NJC27988.1 hypothetical protein [Neolewinella antarctica]
MQLSPRLKYYYLPWATGLLVMLMVKTFAADASAVARETPAPVSNQIRLCAQEPEKAAIITMPYFPGCQGEVGYKKRQCSEAALQIYLKEHAGFPSGKVVHQTAGNASIEIWIGPDGSISNHRMIASPGYGRGEDLRHIVTDVMAKEIKWEPATIDGLPVTVSTTVRLHYNMLWGG